MLKSISIRVISSLILAVLLLGNVYAQDGDITELVIAQGTDIPGFDAHAVTTTAYDAVVVNIFDSLIMMDGEGERHPALASEWEIIDDDQWRFFLREGVVWHDGEPFTAADVKFTLERIASDDSLARHDTFAIIREVEIVDDYEVIIHTDGPDPILINRLSSTGGLIYPQHYIEQVGWDEFTVNPIGTGPFRFVSWERDDRVVMEAFDDHWRGRPVWDRLIHRSIPEASTRVNELMTGGVHVATNIPTQDVDRIEDSGVAQVAPWPTTRIYNFVFNPSEDRPTGDPRVRAAIDYAIDAQLLIDTVMDGFGIPVKARVNPGMTAAPLELHNTQTYDPERAVELLSEAGYEPGELTIRVQAPTGRYPQDSDIAELVAIMLEAVGINTELEILEWGAYTSRIWHVGNIEHMALVGTANPLYDAWYSLRGLAIGGSHAERGGWYHEEYTELVDAVESEMNPERRAELAREAFDIILNERPQIYLFQITNLAGVSNDLDWSPREDELLWMFDASPR